MSSPMIISFLVYEVEWVPQNTVKIWIQCQPTFRSRRLRTPSNKLIVNLTLADFILLSMCHFVTLQNVLGPTLGIWFGVIGCKFYGFVTSIAALTEIWTLTLVSVDRCQAIFYPLETKKRMTSVQVIFIF